MGFDLDQLGGGAEAVWKVVHPVKGEIEGMTITLAGLDSERMNKAQREAVDRRLLRARSGKDADAATLEEESINSLVKATVAWTGFIRGGIEMPCTAENVRALYADPKFGWLRKGVANFVNNDANFFDKSVTISA